MEQRTIITDKMRAILVDWLVQVHLRFRLLQETLYMTISILDRFLSVSYQSLFLDCFSCYFIECRHVAAELSLQLPTCI